MFQIQTSKVQIKEGSEVEVTNENQSYNLTIFEIRPNGMIVGYDKIGNIIAFAKKHITKIIKL